MPVCLGNTRGGVGCRAAYGDAVIEDMRVRTGHVYDYQDTWPQAVGLTERREQKMFHHDEFRFYANAVLTSAQLQETSHYAAQMLDLMYAGYSDGIISGAHVSVEDDFLLVSSGMIRHHGKLYHMEKSERIPYLHTGTRTVLKLRFLDVQERENGLRYDTELILSEDEHLFPYEMELGRFWSEPGAMLRIDDGGWKEMAAAHNYFDIRNVPYAAIGVSTIAPFITYAFA